MGVVPPARPLPARPLFPVSAQVAHTHLHARKSASPCRGGGGETAPEQRVCPARRRRPRAVPGLVAFRGPIRRLPQHVVHTLRLWTDACCTSLAHAAAYEFARMSPARAPHISQALLRHEQLPRRNPGSETLALHVRHAAARDGERSSTVPSERRGELPAHCSTERSDGSTAAPQRPRRRAL